jgi:hypothetical protein
MSISGIILRIRKWIQRMPMVLLWRMDFKKRWVPSVDDGLGWDVYVRELKHTLRGRRRIERMRKEMVRWKELGAERRPIFSWLPSYYRPALYVCPDCRKVDDGSVPLLVFQTVGVWLSDASRSPWVYTAVSCTACGTIQTDDSPYIPHARGFREPVGGQGKGPSYHLSYTVSYGSEYVRHRRQERHRVTHALIDTRAEAVPFHFGTPAPQPDLGAMKVTRVRVGGYELGDAHPLFQALLPLIRTYEEGRMK